MRSTTLRPSNLSARHLALVAAVSTVLSVIFAATPTAPIAQAAGLAAPSSDCELMGIPTPSVSTSSLNVKGVWNYTGPGPDGPLSITLQCGGYFRGTLKLGSDPVANLNGTVWGSSYPAPITFKSQHGTAFSRDHKGKITRGFTGPLLLRVASGMYTESPPRSPACCFEWRATRIN